MDRTSLLLVLDADDTLWESGSFFERTEHDFLSIMESLGFDRDLVRRIVHHRDIERLSVTGYGARPYIDTLRGILGSEAPNAPEWARQAMDDLEHTLLGHPVILLPGVLETMRSLRGYPVTPVVYTMGEHSHQMDKFVRSGLQDLVAGCRIVPLKTVARLEELLAEFGATASGSLLVGDSPRSDINPAITVGMRAVHVARSRTWAAEREDFADPGQVVTIERFDELPGILDSVLGRV
jgi:putative hydrolase of the HAD superfamily